MVFRSPAAPDPARRSKSMLECESELDFYIILIAFIIFIILIILVILITLIVPIVLIILIMRSSSFIMFP